VRVASVQWSPSREAVERTRIVDTRVDEVDKLVELRMYSQLLPAISAMQQAVVEAKEALDDARKEGELPGKAEVQLNRVMDLGKQVLAKVAVVARTASFPLNDSTRSAIQAAVQDTQDVLVTPPRDTEQATPTPGPAPSAGSPTPSTPAGPGPDPTAGPAQPTATTPEPTTTQAPVTTTTVPPTTTTAPPDPPTTDTVTPGSAGGGDTGGDKGADEKAPAEDPAAEQATGDTTTP
jgi:hypothetical protein